MNANRLFFIILIVLLITGCASRANSIAPSSVSASEYSNMSCEDTNEALSNAREVENTLVRKQNNAATADAASVFVFLLPLGSVFGGDVSGELAQAKGEVRALERAVDINCGNVQGSSDDPRDKLVDSFLRQSATGYILIEVQGNQENYAEIVKSEINEKLKDPDSAQYRNVTVMGEGSELYICGELNARNSFGGYTGYKRFIANFSAYHPLGETAGDVLYPRLCR